MEKATFGAGCFWGVEETFRNVPGVSSTALAFGSQPGADFMRARTSAMLP